ncbi:hypothetical protein BGZ83_010662 [Gryganskiella cystojenkinii]|nr:hypothetical protein BGZ83_010662 [Gryganskiella cystojenkinii]
MVFSGAGYRLGSDGGSDFVGDRPVDIDLVSDKATTVPSLRELCLLTLERYADLLEDLGETPYYLIESVLKKCSVKQLTRIEDHTEGLAEMTDGKHYSSKFGMAMPQTSTGHFVRSTLPTTRAASGARYTRQDKELEEQERFERERAKLRQSYNQHNMAREVRRVIVDPTLRVPKKPLRSVGSSSSGWSSAAPKKKSLFEKARQEARKITQMFNSNPYPPPMSRTRGENVVTNIRRQIPPPSFASTRHAIAPTSIFANRDHIPLGLSTASPRSLSSSSSAPSSPLPIRKARYNYKVRPVVYTTGVRSVAAQPSSTQTSPTRPNNAHSQISPTAPGAIANFFKELNPIHARNSATSHHDSMEEDPQSRSPTSPVQPASKTIQILREIPASGHASNSSSSSSAASSGQKLHRRLDKRGHGPGTHSGPKTVKNDGDFKWLEDDDDDDNDDHHVPSKRPAKATETNSKASPKKPLTVEEAGKIFFNSLTGK